MRKGLAYTTVAAALGSALLTVNWFIETSIAAGTLTNALLVLIGATVWFGLLIAHDRAETKREAARERRYQAAELRARLAEETEAWRMERRPWN